MTKIELIYHNINNVKDKNNGQDITNVKDKKCQI